jgi:hypothetical protein
MKHFIHLYCAANDKKILARNLLRSPEVDEGRVPITVIWDARSASVAYHDAISKATSDILVFAHQDIYFPEGWFAQLQRVCESLTSIDPLWAVVGLVGMTPDWRFVGHLWDSGLGFVCGGPFGAPQEVVSLDEVVLIVRRGAGISFDPGLPSFHLYGTDIVLRARNLRKKAYVIDLPVIHNTKPILRLHSNYVAAYRFMVRKWNAVLPSPTVILPLTRNPLPLIVRALRLRYKALLRSSTLHGPLEDPEFKAQELGFARVESHVEHMARKD